MVKIPKILCVLLLASLIVAVSLNKMQVKAQVISTVNYTETTSNTPNPERGFYRNYYGRPNISELLTYKQNGTTLYRTVYDISAFIKLPFSQAFLDIVNQDAMVFRQAGAKIMPNFQYSAGNANPNDATAAVIINHVE